MAEKKCNKCYKTKKERAFFCKEKNKQYATCNACRKKYGLTTKVPMQEPTIKLRYRDFLVRGNR